jgi:hypothetical protein
MDHNALDNGLQKLCALVGAALAPGLRRCGCLRDDACEETFWWRHGRVLAKRGE